MKELLEKLACDNVELCLFGPDSYHDEWSIKLEKNSDGVKLEIKVENVDLETAVREAHDKFYNIAQHGVEEFRGQLLEAPKPLDDEIPF